MPCQYDWDLGPTLPSANDSTHCREFDFTVAFEDTVFSLVPSIFLLCCVFYSLPSVLATPRVIDWPAAALAKLVGSIPKALYCGLGAVQLADLCIYASRRGDLTVTAYTLPATSFLLAAVIALSAISLIDHPRSVRPFGLIQLYLTLTLLLDAARLRTRWLLGETSVVASLDSANLAAKLLLLLIESLPKHSYQTQPTNEAITPEGRSGFFNRSFLLWLNPVLFRGYRTKLQIDNLYAIDDALASTALTQRLSLAWSSTKPARRRRLALALSEVFARPLLLVQFPRLALVAFAIAQPLLVSAALRYAYVHAELPWQTGPALVGAFALVYIGVALSTVWSQHLTFRMLTMVRGALVGIIYQHSLGLPVSGSNGGEELVSLMNTDIERILQTLQWVLNVFPNVVQVGIGLYILYSRMGPVFVAPILVAALCGLGVYLVGKKIPPKQRRWMQAIQKRIGVASEVIRQIKAVKFSALTEIVSGQIQSHRESEIREQKAFRRLQVTIIGLGNTPAMLTPAVTFAAFAIAESATGDNRFQVETAFTSLALLSIMINPIAELVTASTNLASALSCLDRIQEFLQKEPLAVGGDNQELTPRPQDMPEHDSYDKSGSVPKAQEPDTTGSPMIRLVGASIGYASARPVLHNIDLEVLPSTTVMILGPVGSGKSTLLRSLLGEARILSGKIKYPSVKQTAYCDQDPWLLNKSIQDNIIAFSPHDEERYNKVIQACHLEEDLDALPDGGQTVVGSDGVTLSGGQKMRVSLARAAYSGKPLVVIDGGFAGLDPKTASRCFASLLGSSGLLKRENRTMVIATNNPRWIHWADQVVELDHDGRVKMSGSPESMQSTDDHPSEFDDPESRENIGPLDDCSGPVKGKTEIAESSAENCTRPEKPNAIPGGQAQEEPEPGPRPLRFYLSLMGVYPLLTLAFLVVLHIGCNTAQPVWLKLWVSANRTEPNSDVGRWVGVYAMFAVATIAFIAIQTGFFLLVIVPRVAKDLHETMIQTTLSFTGDLNLVDLGLPLSFLLTVEKMVLVAAEVVLTCLASGYLAIAIPFLAALRVLELAAKAPLVGHALSAHRGLATIRAYAWEPALGRAFGEALDRAQRPYYLLLCLQRWLTLVLDLTAAGLAALLMGVAVVLLRSDAAVDPGYLGVALVSVMSFGQVVGALVTQWTTMETSLGAVERIAGYLQTAPREHHPPDQGPDGAAMGVEKQPPAGWPRTGEVVLRSVNASYGGRRVLHDVNLVFPAGSKVILCGRTGSGKSTLLGLLLRMVECDDGFVTFDGVDIARVPPHLLRKAVVGLPQDVLFLRGTVRYNLDPFDRYPDDDACLWRVLSRTGLSAIIAAKGGLEADLDIDWLSTGQRQLFCFARTMLRKSKILLLDEATSYLETEMESQVNKIIATDFKDWTVIAITHTPKSALIPGSCFDTAVVLRDGRVEEIGKPSDLLAQGGAFAELVRLDRDGNA
ncbi:ABC transporter [Apiospora sp. TS-2023a]